MKIRAMEVNSKTNSEITLYDKILPIHFIKAENNEEEFKPLEPPRQYMRVTADPHKKVNYGTRLAPVVETNKFASEQLTIERGAEQLRAQTNVTAYGFRNPNQQHETRPQRQRYVLEDEQTALAHEVTNFFAKVADQFEQAVLTEMKMSVEEMLIIDTTYRVKEMARRFINDCVIDFLEKDKTNVKNANVHAQLRKNIKVLIDVYCISFKFRQNHAKRAIEHLNENSRQEHARHQNI